jgi:Uma2 family endonuclease
MSTLSKNYLTPEQYLEIERKAEFKSEYRPSERLAVAAGQRTHGLITMAVGASLHQQLRSQRSEVYAAGMRVADNYPDVVVVCGEPKFLGTNFDTLLNPTLVVEVLSESTEADDRGRKFQEYFSLESLAEYLLISSCRVSADLFTRLPDGTWRFTPKLSLEDSLGLESVGCRLALADLYERIEFCQTQPRMVPLRY